MADGTIQVTIPASGVVNIATGLPSYKPANIYMQNLQIQNNAANPIRYGRDDTVSVTTPAAVNGGTAGKGILLFPSGAGGVAAFINYTSFLSDWWVAGTPGDVIDVLYVQ